MQIALRLLQCFVHLNSVKSLNRQLSIVIILVGLLPKIAVAQNLAIVNGTPIKRSTLIDLTRILEQSANSPVTDKTLKQQEESIRQNLIRNAIITTMAKRKGVDKKPFLRFRLMEAELELLVKSLFLDYMLKDKQKNQQFLEQYQKFVQLVPPIEYNVSHIVVPSKKDALQMLALLNNGAPFEDVAKRYSIDPGSKDAGGSLGWSPGISQDPEFAKTFRKLSIGAISQPVQTTYGWHIIKLNNRRKVQIPTFEASKRKMVERILQDPQIRAFELQQWLTLQQREARKIHLSQKELKEIVDLKTTVAINRKNDDSMIATKKITEQFQLRRHLKQLALRQNLAQNPLYNYHLQDTQAKILFEALLDDHLMKNPEMNKQLREIYNNSIGQLSKHEKLIGQIIVKTEADANTVIGALNSGESFADVGKRFSIDQKSVQGTWINPSVVTEPFKSAIAPLNVGGFTGKPIQSAFGWIILKLIAERPAKIPTFEAMRPELITRLTLNQSSFSIIINDFKQNLIKKSTIQ